MIRLAEVNWPIKVGPDDVRFGIPGQADACPVARALKRETGQTWWAYRVGASSIREACHFGRRLQRWTTMYDRGQVPSRALLLRYDPELEELEVSS